MVTREFLALVFGVRASAPEPEKELRARELRRRQDCYATALPEQWPSYSRPIIWGFVWHCKFECDPHGLNRDAYLAYRSPGWNAGETGWMMREDHLRMLGFRQQI